MARTKKNPSILSENMYKRKKKQITQNQRFKKHNKRIMWYMYYILVEDNFTYWLHIQPHNLFSGITLSYTFTY